MQATSDIGAIRIISGHNLPSRLRDAGLVVVVCLASKLPAALREQLIRKSRQPHIMEHVGGNDSVKRFKDNDTFDAWAKQERIMYALLAPQNGADIDISDADLAGVSWFGEKTRPAVPGYDVTFAVRLYEDYVGKGLAVPFLRLAHEDARRYFPGRRMWLDFAADNEAAGRTYEKLGYTELARSGDRILMGNETIMAEPEREQHG